MCAFVFVWFCTCEDVSDVRRVIIAGKNRVLTERGREGERSYDTWAGQLVMSVCGGNVAKVFFFILMALASYIKM